MDLKNDGPACLHWRRQLWGTGARAPLDFRLILLVTSEPHKLWHWALCSMWLPTQKEYAGLWLCHCLLHEFRNILVCA